MRGEAVVVAPDTSIRDTARAMTASGATAVVIRLPSSLGIVTDRDLRSRVIAEGVGVDDPISAVMTAPAYTVAPDRLGGGVLLEMLDRGIRHFPVISARGELLGVIEDQDLIAIETRNSFYVRRQIAAAQSTDELAAAAHQLRPMVVALHDTKLAATSIAAIYSVVLDAITRRAVELALAELGEPDTPFAWLALGSQARREAVPSSDVDSAIVWYGSAEEREVRPRLHEVATHAVAALERCGLRPDQQGASASNLRFVRSEESWRRVARSWLADPTQEKALILTSVLVDSRPVWGIHAGTPVAEEFCLAPQHPELLRQLARFSLSYRPPTGFLRGTGGRAQRRAPRTARPQTRRHHPDRRPRALGRNGGRRHLHLDGRAPARRGRGRHPAARRRDHAAGGPRAGRRAARRAPGRPAAGRADP